MIKIIFIILLFINIGFSSETKFFYSENDSIKVQIDDQSNDKIILKTYNFSFLNNQSSLPVVRFTLWRFRNDYIVFCKLHPNVIYLLKDEILAKVSDVAIFYLSDEYYHDQWNIYDGFERQKNWDKIVTKSNIIGLEEKSVTLKSIVILNETKLFNFEISGGNTHLVENYVFDKNLNLYEFNFRDSLEKNSLKTFKLKNY